MKDVDFGPVNVCLYVKALNSKVTRTQIMIKRDFRVCSSTGIRYSAGFQQATKAEKEEVLEDRERGTGKRVRGNREERQTEIFRIFNQLSRNLFQD